MDVIEIKTSQKHEVVNLTQRLCRLLIEKKYEDGVLTVFVPHTTAGIFINEGADPDVSRDILAVMKQRIAPEDFDYHHAEGNSPAHVGSVVCGSSVQVIVEDFVMKLGAWQGVFFAEFDGPRSRQVWVKFLAY
ncbi:MAG: YjbQ family protein [Deltaproteobacteria bacterium]|nr:YjbQ family protein [Deltaproteobacteria bacterium]